MHVRDVLYGLPASLASFRGLELACDFSALLPRELPYQLVVRGWELQ